MRRKLICSMIALMWAASAAADSDSQQLRGDYGFTGSADCLVTDRGFDPATFTANAGAISASLSFAVEGIRTFKKNGTGTVKATTFGITPRPTLNNVGLVAAGTADVSFKFTYTVDGEGGWTSKMVPGSFIAIHKTGPRAGQTSTVDEIPPIVGMISNDGNTLIAAHVTPKVETHTYSNGDVQQRICHRSRVFIRLNRHGDDGHHGDDD